MLTTDNKGQTNYRCFYNGKIKKNNMNQHIVIYGELEMNIPCQIIPLIYNTILWELCKSTYREIHSGPPKDVSMS